MFMPLSQGIMYETHWLDTFCAYNEKKRIVTSFGPFCDLENKAKVNIFHKVMCSCNHPKASYMKNQTHWLSIFMHLCLQWKKTKFDKFCSSL